MRRTSRLFLILFIFVSRSPSSAQQLPDHFFGMNVLHAIHKTPWPSVPVFSIRLWDSDETRWDILESARGKFDFSGLDQWLALASEHHCDVLYTFGRVPRWANGNQRQSVPPTNLADWDAFVRAIVKHSNGRIAAYELWNEPNQPNFWTGDVKTLVEMTERAYRIIKSEQPNAIVTTPSPTWSESSSPSQWLAQYFAAGGGKYADVIAFHGYIGTSPEPLTRELERIRAVAKKYGLEGKPIWDTESGWGIDSKLADPRAQAEFLARSYILHVSQGVHRFYWYAWDGSDGGSTPAEYSWGTLWDQKGEREPARALRTIYTWLHDAKLPILCTTNNTVWRCQLNTTNLLLWDSVSQHSYEVGPNFVRFRDLSDEVHPVPPDKRITIGPSPILLEPR